MLEGASRLVLKKTDAPVRHYSDQGMREFVVSMLVRRIKDFAIDTRKIKNADQRKRARSNKVKARIWIFCESRDGIRFPGFECLCDYLGYDPKKARKKILAYEKAVKRGTWKRPEEL
jgi:hypothetical protein